MSKHDNELSWVQEKRLYFSPRVIISNKYKQTQVIHLKYECKKNSIELFHLNNFLNTSQMSKFLVRIYLPYNQVNALLYDIYNFLVLKSIKI